MVLSCHTIQVCFIMKTLPKCLSFTFLFFSRRFPLFQLFDAFKARLQESNSKVNLYALESLQKIIHLLKDNLSQVVNILVPAIVDNHLNSKNSAIYLAAIGAIDALILNLGTHFEHSNISGRGETRGSV